MTSSVATVRYENSVIWSPHVSPNGLVSRYLSDFEEIYVIGEGSFGVVVKCNSKVDGGVYAVKKVPLLLLPYENIKREIVALRRMEHQNIVRYYTSWVESCIAGKYDGPSLNCPCLYIQMEFCPKSLDAFLADPKFREDIDLKWRIFRQILDGLSHIHEKNLIHRDLCPNNIFLDKENNVKIGDFGLVKFLDSKGTSTKISNTDGNKLYQAPEIDPGYLMQGLTSATEVEITQKVDIFSLGLILTDLMYSFPTEAARKTAFSRLRRQRAPSHLHDSLDSLELIWKLVDKDPSKRLATGDIKKQMQAYMPTVVDERAGDKPPLPGLPVDLRGKRAFVVGVAHDKGFAWAIAKSLAAAGAEILVGTPVREVEMFNNNLYSQKFDASCMLSDGRLMDFTKIYPLDVYYDCPETVPEHVKNLECYKKFSNWTVKEVFQSIKQDFGTIDILVHSTFSFPRISQPLLETSRSTYLAAMSASYSFVSLVKHFLPIMNQGASTISLTYNASERIIPGCGGGMCSSMAAVESDTRMLAFEAGRERKIRVNTISVGPIRGKATKNEITWPDQLIEYSWTNAPLQKALTADEVGNAAAFLASPLASAITGSVVYVDNGLNAMGVAVDSPALQDPLDQGAAGVKNLYYSVVKQFFIFTRVPSREMSIDTRSHSF